MRKLRMLTAALIGLTLLTGCAKTIVATADQICAGWKEIGVSRDDRLTQHTAAQILGNNEARKAWSCPPEPRPAAAKQTPTS